MATLSDRVLCLEVKIASLQKTQWILVAVLAAQLGISLPVVTAKAVPILIENITRVIG